MVTRLLSFCFCLCVLMLFTVGCTKTSTYHLNEPPSAVAVVEGKQLMLIKGSYRWNNAIADAPSPDILVKDSTVYVVKPNRVLSLIFKGEEPDKVTVGLWENQNFVGLQPKEEGFLLPNEPGVYVLSIGGEWPGNDNGSYAVSIEVQE